MVLEKKSSVKRVKVMKAFSVGVGGGKKIFFPGGTTTFDDVNDDGEPIKVVMRSGEVREVPKKIVDEYNSRSKKRNVFVKPGSQKEGVEKDVASDGEIQESEE